MPAGPPPMMQQVVFEGVLGAVGISGDEGSKGYWTRQRDSAT